MPMKFLLGAHSLRLKRMDEDVPNYLWRIERSRSTAQNRHEKVESFHKERPTGFQCAHNDDLLLRFFAPELMMFELRLLLLLGVCCTGCMRAFLKRIFMCSMWHCIQGTVALHDDAFRYIYHCFLGVSRWVFLRWAWRWWWRNTFITFTTLCCHSSCALL